ncbi:MAG TPA: UDP-N-acetylmuramoyl-L-alanyl-D-glutamate--2,6-diaminopimelate ligase [Candidatus Saccharimonadales bacterium]|nr:UDP-N-acetylmuramoyl-L-alanyl-D-glutamate--2,6-diaminopimelate ligase [Candidatus Saccharimonadales bacterium]
MNPRKLVKKLIPRRLFRLVEPYGHWAEAIILNVVHGFPARGMNVIGVTGTDGKTTTCFLIHRMLLEAGYNVGVMTTVGWGVGLDIKPQKEHMTTVPVPILLRRIKEMKRQKIDWLVLETSSHALAQHRVWSLPYSIAVLTNISHEHLDYHGTFKRYREAKRCLFKMTNRHHSGLRTGVINADDDSVNLFAKVIKHSVLYGINHGELRAKGVVSQPTGISYRAELNGQAFHIKSKLVGHFNVYNTLAAVGVGQVLGLTRQQIEKGVGALEAVPGRMEKISAGQPFEVIVDYAVTPEALERTLQEIGKSAVGRVLVVFGATGDRDKTKRPIMGEAAAKNADLIFLTDDETYTEDPEAIRQSVYAGIKKAGGEGRTKIIGDRREAIITAFNSARRGDAVLLAGIGHQTTRNMGGVDEPWDERQIARELLTE